MDDVQRSRTGALWQTDAESLLEHHPTQGHNPVYNDSTGPPRTLPPKKHRCPGCQRAPHVQPQPQEPPGLDRGDGLNQGKGEMHWDTRQGLLPSATASVTTTPGTSSMLEVARSDFVTPESRAFLQSPLKLHMPAQVLCRTYCRWCHEFAMPSLNLAHVCPRRSRCESFREYQSVARICRCRYRHSKHSFRCLHQDFRDACAGTCAACVADETRAKRKTTQFSLTEPGTASPGTIARRHLKHTHTHTHHSLPKSHAQPMVRECQSGGAVLATFKT